MTQENTHQPSSTLAAEANSRSSSAAGEPAESRKSTPGYMTEADADALVSEILKMDYAEAQEKLRVALGRDVSQATMLSKRWAEELRGFFPDGTRMPEKKTAALMTDKESRLARDLDVDGETEEE